MRGQALYGFADQAVISLGNLAIGLVLIRLTAKEEYGLFILGFGILSLILSLNSALITAPMTVLAYERKEPAEVIAYCRALFGVQMRFGLTLAALGTIAVAAGGKFGLSESDVRFGLAIALAVPGVLLQEFSRRFYYLQFKPQRALALDLLALLTSVGTIGIAVLTEWPEKHVIAMAGLGAAGFLSSAVGLAWSGMGRTSGGAGGGREFSTCWVLGRWALLGAVITWVQNQTYAYFLSWFGGLANLAEANAARLLLAPLPMLNTGLASVWMPRLAKLCSQGRAAEAERQSLHLRLVLSGIVIGYAVALWNVRETVVPLVLGERYSDVSIFLWAWAAVNLLTVLRANFTVLMQALREFRAITLANFWSALMVVATTAGFIQAYGTMGSLYALAAGELLLGLLLWRASRRALKHTHDKAPESAPPRDQP